MTTSSAVEASHERDGLRGARFVHAEWTRPSAAAPWTAALEALAGRPDDALALGLGLPFCAMRCGYCSDDVSVTADAAEIDAYVDALLWQMDRAVGWIGTEREVVQVHLGGGTPNRLAGAQLERLVGAVRMRFRTLPETEWSIECDPRRCSAAQFDTLRRLGFGHLHLGMADLDAGVQRASGRLQSATVMHDVVSIARAARFESVRVDLVCGLPGQTEATWRSSLDGVLRLGVDRVRCLRYRHQPSRSWNQFAIDADALPRPPECEALGRLAADTLVQAGHVRIGPDLFVLEGDALARAAARGELRRTALGPTALPVDHLLGFGAGQVSEVLGVRALSLPSRIDWQRQVAAGDWAMASVHRHGVLH
jgi:oxygen-independent coproporphyrinogen III oxidase